MSLTPKQRAHYMSETGMSEKAIAGVLGIELADVQRLMVEAEPDVELPGGGGIGAPLSGVDNDPYSLNSLLPDATSIDEYDDLYRITAPTEAALYLFQMDVFLASKDDHDAEITMFVTDAATFNEYLNGAGALGTPYYKTCRLRVAGADAASVLETVHMLVGGGSEVALYARGAAQFEGVSAGASNASWVPLA
jgi:hypothetical protein